MDKEKLKKQLMEYGADIAGINSRFLGDFALYESCLREFMNDADIPLLEQAVSERNYDKAFAAAHTLKGVSGNMGLTPCYDAVCVMTESLRSKEYGSVDAELLAISEQFRRLRDVFSDLL